MSQVFEAGEPDPMETEFDTVAAWTEQVVADLGSDYAIPAACRGSGSPSWLGWLAEQTQVGRETRFLDAGAGLGGPAAWVRESYDARPVLAEPMSRACLGAHRLFGMPVVTAWSQQLPFTDDSFDVAWLLGVLCTTTEKRQLLQELRRVLAPGGALGLLVLVQVGSILPFSPEGNEFPTPASLADDLSASGFQTLRQVRTPDLPAPDESWRRRVQRVDEALAQRFGGGAEFERAQFQSETMAELLRSGAVETWLLSCRAV